MCFFAKNKGKLTSLSGSITRNDRRAYMLVVHDVIFFRSLIMLEIFNLYTITTVCWEARQDVSVPSLNLRRTCSWGDVVKMGPCSLAFAIPIE